MITNVVWLGEFWNGQRKQGQREEQQWKQDEEQALSEAWITQRSHVLLTPGKQHNSAQNFYYLLPKGKINSLKAFPTGQVFRDLSVDAC